MKNVFGRICQVSFHDEIFIFILLFTAIPTWCIAEWSNTKLSKDFSSMMTSLICLRNFLIPWCLSTDSVPIINLDIYLLSLYPPLWIDKLTFANVVIIDSHLQH